MSDWQLPGVSRIYLILRLEVLQGDIHSPKDLSNMPKFVPRIRKHKVLARLKEKTRNAEPIPDTNAVEHVPAAKAEMEEKKRRMKEELQADGPKVSGKKAKRLEKYIETKLKKDENRDLLAQLSREKQDTSLYASSRKLGQGKETKRERLSRALKDKQAGIDIDGDNDEVLFKPRVVRDEPDQSSSEDEEVEPTRGGLFQKSTSNSIIIDTPRIAAGGGLKRPLDIDDDGKPVLKKRKRRGGVKSKIILQPPVKAKEPEWEGFKSESEMATDSESEAERTLNGYADISDASDDESEVEEDPELEADTEETNNDSDQSKDSDESEDSSSEEESESDEDGSPQKLERSSAFKSWANQQLNDALGYETVAPLATETPKIAGFKARPMEEDPVPVELQQTSNVDRKAYSVSVERTSEIQEVRLKLPVVAEEQKIMEAVHNGNLIVSTFFHGR